VTHKEKKSAQATYRVPRPRYTECTKTFLGSIAVRLSPREPKKCYGRIGTSIQEFKHEEPKRQERTRVLLSIDPLAITTTGVTGLETKHQTNKRGSIHILLDRWGLISREEEWSSYSFDQLIMGQRQLGKRNTTPRSIPTYNTLRPRCF